jgi:hypothetical protein
LARARSDADRAELSFEADRAELSFGRTVSYATNRERRARYPQKS